jgi:rhodanese-related sulfurtransferase
MKHSPQFLAIVQDSKSRVEEYNIQQVKSMLDSHEEFTLVDTREESEWDKVHIQGAMHIGKGVLERDIETKIPDSSTKIVLYCGGGFRSALAADNLQKMGYTQVISMDGGMSAWLNAGFPTDK